MYKLLVLATSVALANCNELDKVNGNWYPIAFFLPGEDVSSVYQVCQSTLYTKSDRTFSCGNFNFTGGVQTELEGDVTAVVPAIVVHTYEEATRTVSLLKGCQFLNLLRFVGKYMIAYNVYDTENGINMFLMAKEVPTRADLEAFIESEEELDKSEDETVVCTQEVMAKSENKRASSRDSKKITSPLKILERKFFAKH